MPETPTRAPASFPEGADLRYYDQPDLWLKEGPIGDAAQGRRADRIAAEVMAWRPSRVLEIGAGNGIIANRLTVAGVEAVATDISAEALRHVTGTAIVASADDLPFPDGSFDVAVASEVLEHLPDAVLERATRELARVTRSSIVLSVPNDEDLAAAAVRCPSCHCRFHAHRHVQRFNADRIAGAIPGFRALSVARFGPHDVRVSGLEALIRRDALGMRTAWSPMAVCPQCGFHADDMSPSEVGQRRRGFLARPIRRRRVRWLLAVLERADAGRAGAPGG